MDDLELIKHIAKLITDAKESLEQSTAAAIAATKADLERSTAAAIAATREDLERSTAAAIAATRESLERSNAAAIAATKRDLELLITDMKESLEREIQAVRDDLRSDVAQLNQRFDAQAARLDRQGGLLQTGSRWTNLMNQWAEKVDTAIGGDGRQITELRTRINRLEHPGLPPSEPPPTIPPPAE